MKLILSILIPVILAALLYAFVEGTIGFGGSFKILDKVVGVEFKAGIRELPKTIEILR